MQSNNETKTFFSHSVSDNMDSIYAMAMRLTRNNTDAEDLVAESVTKAWAAIDSLEERTGFRPWLFRILHNCFISNYRKKKCRPVEVIYQEAGNDEQEVASLLVQQPDEFLNWWANPEREYTNTLLGDDISAAIDKLPEAFRMTIVLVNIEGLSYDKAAEVLGVSPGTIRSRMNRGRTLLQKALWMHAKDADLIQEESLTEG